jgi:autophagy-related protein 9
LKSPSKFENLIFYLINYFCSRFISFTSGAILAVLIILTVYDEDVLNVDHMLTLMTGLGVVLGICRSLIPDEVGRKESFFFLFC